VASDDLILKQRNCGQAEFCAQKATPRQIARSASCFKTFMIADMPTY
jgi:hypothetical protein